jgi:nitrite reductase (NO-forming)
MRRVSHAYWRIPIILAALVFGLAACGTAPNQTSQAAGSTIEIHAFDLGFKPNAVTLEKPGRYTVKLVNDGAIAHDIAFPDGAKVVANSKETKTLDIDVPAAGTTFICSIPGHAEAGMKGMITVTGGATSTTSHGAGDHSGPLPETDVKADQNAPPYKLFDAAAPAALDGTVHDIELVTQEVPMTVAEGFVQPV